MDIKCKHTQAWKAHTARFYYEGFFFLLFFQITTELESIHLNVCQTYCFAPFLILRKSQEPIIIKKAF